MSYMINSVSVEGTIVGDTKIISEKDGVATITANQIKFVKHVGDKAYASWFSIKGYGKFASLLLNLREGDHVLVYGVLKQERWEKAGKKSSVVVIEPYKILLAESIGSSTILDNENKDELSETPDEEENFDF